MNILTLAVITRAAKVSIPLTVTRGSSLKRNMLSRISSTAVVGSCLPGVRTMTSAISPASAGKSLLTDNNARSPKVSCAHRHSAAISLASLPATMSRAETMSCPTLAGTTRVASRASRRSAVFRVGWSSDTLSMAVPITSLANAWLSGSGRLRLFTRDSA